jgi:hypothetical protein
MDRSIPVEGREYRDEARVEQLEDQLVVEYRIAAQTPARNRIAHVYPNDKPGDRAGFRDARTKPDLARMQA